MDGSGEAYIWEAGHFYESKGPTQLSVIGWSILAQLAPSHHARMLFVDDVHEADQLHCRERELDVVLFNPDPDPTHYITESQVLDHGHAALGVLKKLPRRKRARQNGSGAWQCAGFTLIDSNKKPRCLLYDLGLTLLKFELGFRRGYNILPAFYAREQRQLLRLAKRVVPEFELVVILYEESGEWLHLEPFP